MTLLTRLGTAMGLILALGCNTTTDELTDRIHQDAKAAWAANGPASYAMTVNRACICDGPQEPVRVTVQNRAVVSRVVISTSEPVAAGVTSEYPDVPGLFAMVENARRSSAFSIIVEYHQTLGYPTQITLNFNPGSVTDDRAYAISTLDPLP